MENLDVVFLYYLRLNCWKRIDAPPCPWRCTYAAIQLCLFKKNKVVHASFVFIFSSLASSRNGGYRTVHGLCVRVPFLYIHGLFIALSGNMQSTYVIFGEAYVEKSGSGGGSHYPTARSASAEEFLKPAPGKFAPAEVEVRKV